MSTLRAATQKTLAAFRRQPTEPASGSSFLSSPLPVRYGLIRFDTYDIWANGTPIETGIQTYDEAIGKARAYSGQMPYPLFYVFYSGVYGNGPNHPRPLAVFWAAAQLPFPIRLTAPVTSTRRSEIHHDY